MKQEPVETEEEIELTPEEIAELDDRADAVERGEYVDGDEVIRRLRTGYDLTSEEDDEIEASIAQIARGECVTAKELFAELRAIRVRTCDASEAL